MKSVDRIQAYTIAGIIFVIHYLYFQKGNRIIKKITFLKPKVSLTNIILTITYVFGSILLFFYFGNFGLKNSLFLIILICLMTAYAYLFGKRNKQFD